MMCPLSDPRPSWCACPRPHSSRFFDSETAHNASSNRMNPLILIFKPLIHHSFFPCLTERPDVSRCSPSCASPDFPSFLCPHLVGGYLPDHGAASLNLVPASPTAYARLALTPYRFHPQCLHSSPLLVSCFPFAFLCAPATPSHTPFIVTKRREHQGRSSRAIKGGAGQTSSSRQRTVTQGGITHRNVLGGNLLVVGTKRTHNQEEKPS